ELVADHAQRQKLIALQAEDRLQPLQVGLAEQAVAALRTSRRQQPLVLEVADLRDRDVGELGGQTPDDFPDAQQPLTLGGGRRHAMNVIRYLPICTSSPSASGALSIRLRLTNVPLSEPWSSTRNLPFSCTRTAWL